jgi:hypothetical protein
MRTAVRKFEQWRSKGLKLFVVVQTICGRRGNNAIHMLFVVVQTMWLSWKRLNAHTYQVSYPCMQPLTSLKKSSWGYFFVVQTICGGHGNDAISMRTNMCATISKFDEWRGNCKEKCLKLFVIDQTILWLSWKRCKTPVYKVSSSC